MAESHDKINWYRSKENTVVYSDFLKLRLVNLCIIVKVHISISENFTIKSTYTYINYW